MTHKLSEEEAKQADAVVLAAQSFYLQHGPRGIGPETQALMDAISGIVGYKMDSRTPQGYLHTKVLRAQIETNHVIDADTMISKFWEGVWKGLPKVQPQGTKVLRLRRNVRVGPSKGESQYVEEVTKMSPLNYIRSYAVGYARRFIDESFKRRLQQQCLDCHKVMPVGMTREYDSGCPKCGAPPFSGFTQAGFLQKRHRICSDCGHRRPTRFERVCGRVLIDENKNPILDTNGDIQIVDGCKSENVILIQSEEFSFDGSSEGPALNLHTVSNDDDPETRVHDRESQEDVDAFIRAAESAMPRDPGDPTGDSKNRKILRILTNPKEGAEVCRNCHERAMVCPGHEGKTCDTPCTLDSKACCGSSSFSIEDCINYSRKIAEYMGFTTTLANRRVAKVREHTRKFAMANQRRYTTAKYLARRLNSPT